MVGSDGKSQNRLVPWRIWDQMKKADGNNGEGGREDSNSRSVPGRISTEGKRPEKNRSQKKPPTEAYFRQRLNLGPSCNQGECFPNRTNDPFCLCALEPDRIRRCGTVGPNRDFPAGLENLGNTCYMNSYLQTLFHMLPVRRILFDWKYPQIDRQPEKRYDMVVALQSLFVRLQSGTEKAIDPQELVRIAGVDANVQQDVQEFSVLFLDCIDRVLADRKGEEKLQSLFTGKLRTTITCRHCETESSTESDFHELGLKTEDLADVMASFGQFFAPEQIDKYECKKCKQHRTADKKIQIRTLPRFLNLNLLRYAYDRVKNIQRKLTHRVDFPRLLDLRSFLNDDQIREWGLDGCRYDLMSILVHRGGVQKGHYFARIRVSTDGRWYTFNDADVIPYDHKGYETDDVKLAYLLVYEKVRDVEEKPDFPKIPSNLFERDGQLVQQNYVTRAFDSSRLLSGLKVKPGQEMVWMPVDWIVCIARASHTKEIIKAPDIASHICPHGHIEGIQGLKVVDASQAKKLMDVLKFSPRPRLYVLKSLCAICNPLVGNVSNGQGEAENDDSGA